MFKIHCILIIYKTIRLIISKCDESFVAIYQRKHYIFNETLNLLVILITKACDLLSTTEVYL